MKKALLFIALLVSNFLFGQTIKILFDATKAETSGNADWVIDADTHNIGFGSGPAVVGTGDESNPQRFPTPAQSGIIASTAETFWNGSLSSWGIDCVKKGYSVETLPYNGQITYGSSTNVQDLSHYKVFIVCEPNIVFTAAEKTAIMQFIQNGGGLFMVSDHDVSDRNGDGWDSPHIWDDLISSNSVKNYPFGFTFDYDNFSETTTNIPVLPGDSLLHGPMGTVTKMQWSNGTSMTLSPSLNSTVKGVVYKTGSPFDTTNVMVAYARFGAGKVAAIGDSSPPDDGTGDPNDVLYNGWTGDASGNHELLIMNATIWLATTGSPVTTGITDVVNTNLEMNVFPNPFSTTTTLELETQQKIDHGRLVIYDVLGNEVRHMENLNSNTITIDRNELDKGIYFFTLFNDEKMTGKGKFIIN